MKSIPYGRQHIDEDDIRAVTDVLRSDFLTQGPNVASFENSFSTYCGCHHAIAVSNATAGLHLAYKALGVKKGSRVITSPITFASTANAVRFCEGEVWLADIDPRTFLLSLDSVKQLIESKPKGFFSGIAVVDFAGLSADMEAFRSLADDHNLFLLEDAAHAPGGYFTDSKDQKIKTGSGKYAHCSVFSFHPVKHIACGEGGMVTTNDETLAENIKLLRTHGITKTHEMTKNHGSWFYEMVDLGYNYRLTDMQAALGKSQLSKNDLSVERRNQIAKNYKKAFDITGITYQHTPEGHYNAYHLFVIQIDQRLALYESLREHQIYSQVHYIPIHKLPYYKGIGYEEAELKHANNYYGRCLSLPMYPTLSNEEQDYIIEKTIK